MIQPDAIKAELTGGWIVNSEVVDDGSLKISVSHSKGSEIYPSDSRITNGSTEWSINIKSNEDKEITVNDKVTKRRNRRKS